MNEVKWDINGNEIVFDEKEHSYYCNGVRCISVTQLLRMQFPKKYDGVDEEVLKKAAEKGTNIHETIEMYETYGIESNECREFRDYLFLKKTFKFTALGNELPIMIKYKDLIVCGRLDMVIEENGKLGLADIKCTSTLDKEYLSYQLNLYKLGYEQCFGNKIEFLRGIHLKNGTRKYVKLPINEKIVIDLLERYSNEKNKDSSVV